MIISASLSKPVSDIENILGKAYQKVKITAQSGAEGTFWFAEFFTEKQVFHRHFSESELNDFLAANAGKSFKNCVEKTESEEITILANKKGKITRLTKKLNIKLKAPGNNPLSSDKKKKNYILQEGKAIPFLVLLGVMNSEGKVIASKYDKFRQINRFLEFVDDIIDEVIELKKRDNPSEDDSKNQPVRIADFGCGKSYLTFAVHYLLTEIRKIKCEIEGLDLKKDVIAYCNEITGKLGLKNLIFHTGNISDYSGRSDPDIVITLHACDTATDFALKYAVSRNAKAILSVPCCQHQINSQLQKLSSEKKAEIKNSSLAPLLKYGLIRERFSALLTDSLRGEWLENQGYSVQLMEFIDMEGTPKNILIRAVKKSSAGRQQKKENEEPGILEELGLKAEIYS